MIAPSKVQSGEKSEGLVEGTPGGVGGKYDGFVIFG